MMALISRVLISIAFDQLRLTVTLALRKDLQALPHDFAIFPLGSDALSGFELHAPIPLHPSLHEVPLVGLDFAL